MDLDELYPSKFLRAGDLKGREASAVIESVAIEEFDDDGRKRRKPVLYFKNGPKGCVLNKTNAVTVADICGSKDTDAWPGHKVLLYTAMVAYQGRVSEAIRIRAPETPPAAAPAAGVLDDQIPW